MKKTILIIYLVLINLILITNAYSTEISTKYFKLKLMENPTLLEKKEQPDFIYYQYKTNKYFLKIIIAKKAQIDYRKVKLLKNKTFYTKNNLSAYHIIYKDTDKINDSLYTYYDRYFYYIIFQVNPDKYNEYKNIFNSYINNIELYSVNHDKKNNYTRKINLNNNSNNSKLYTDPLNTFTVKTEKNWEGPDIDRYKKGSVYLWKVSTEYTLAITQIKKDQELTGEKNKASNKELLYFYTHKAGLMIKKGEDLNIKGQNTYLLYTKSAHLYILNTLIQTNKYIYLISFSSEPHSYNKLEYIDYDKLEFLKYIDRINFLK